ncbi:MAG: alpha/beta hydrolase-fold protein [Egibacteraceae bacterium]
MRARLTIIGLGLTLVLGTLVGGLSERSASAQTNEGLEFVVRAGEGLLQTPAPGRVFVMVSRSGETEPRFQVDVAGGIPFWGKDVDSLASGDAVSLRDERGVYGYPLRRIRQLPPGDYVVQAFFNTYTTFDRSDGSTVQLPLPCGDGQSMFSQPDNLYSQVQPLTVGGDDGQTVELVLDQRIEPADPVPAGGTCQQGNPPDTEHVKHVKVRSELLSDFWGQPMYVAANVLLPEGYDDPANRTVRYPLVVRHGHFPSRAPFRFTEDGDDDFSRWWLSDEAPRMIVVELRHENPYYDDSYAVNSQNLGPYGDAINTELLPMVERRFRTIDRRWARVLTGGSTGGWEAMATQLFYPEMYAGTWALCPDSLDFRRHQLVNVYEDENAYYTLYDWERVERPSARAVSGDVLWTMGMENHWELALGTHSRSGGQWDVWEAVFGPQGRDGYPARIWNKRTGAINHSVAEAWAPFDLRRKIVDEWAELGPLLTNQLHVYVGDDDTFFLNLGVELFQEAVEELDDPPARAEFRYGENEPHCWSPYSTPELLDQMADHIVEQAPGAARTAQWANPSRPAAPRSLDSSGGARGQEGRGAAGR